MTILEYFGTIYIKPKQPSFYKQKEWLLGQNAMIYTADSDFFLSLCTYYFLFTIGSEE